MQNIEKMKLVLDSESLSIFIDNKSEQPTHVCYWHLDEVAEDENVAISMLRAMQLYYTDKKALLDILGIK